MSRSKTYAIVMALLASAALSTACTRTDATGPSDQPQPSFETQGANNGKSGDPVPQWDVRPTHSMRLNGC